MRAPSSRLSDRAHSWVKGFIHTDTLCKPRADRFKRICLKTHSDSVQTTLYPKNRTTRDKSRTGSSTVGILRYFLAKTGLLEPTGVPATVPATSSVLCPSLRLAPPFTKNVHVPIESVTGSLDHHHKHDEPFTPRTLYLQFLAHR